MIGTTLSHFNITAKLGEGGMGEVYLAEDTKLGREVAIKVLPKAVAQDPERLARFEREAKVLAALNHPNIAGIYSLESAPISMEAAGLRAGRPESDTEDSAGAEAGRFDDGATINFLVMELADGEDLADRIGRGPMPVEEALAIAFQIAEALEAAHERDIVHRDLKPANIKVDDEGKVKVLDFGLAKAMEVGTGTDPDLSESPLSLSPTLTAQMTQAGVLMGTAAYMSPEQARGQEVDKRADIWAFGVVLWEMLSGEQLFAGPTVSDTLAEVLKTGADLSQLPTDTPPNITRLLQRCLQREPRQRLRDIGDARIVLEEAKGWTPGDEPEGATAVAAPTSTMARLLPLAVTSILALALGYLLATTIRREEPPTPLPLRKFEIPIGSVAGTVSLDPELSPDGQFLVYSDANQLWLRDLGSTTPIPLAGTEGATEPFWSPDGAWIGFARGRNIERVARSGGEPTLLAVADASNQLAGGSATWGDDGRIVWTSNSAGLMQVHAQGGDISSLLDPAEGESDFHEVCRLPGDRGFVFVVHKSDGDSFRQLDLLTADGERRQLLTLESGDLAHPVFSPSGHILFWRGGTVPGIWAVSFSIDSLEITGEPFLVAAEGRTASIADDGTLVYVNRGTRRSSRLVWVDRDGGNPQPIGEPLQALYPFQSLSADDSRALVTGYGGGDGREVWVYDTTTGLRRQVTFSNLQQYIAYWVPGEEQILSYSVNPFVMHLTSLDGSEPPKVVGEGIMPNLTPDGSQLLFARQKPDAWDWDIYIRPWDAEPEAAELLIEGPGAVWFPQVSPDGKKLLYTTDETGQDEVFVTSLANPQQRWQLSRNGGSFPFWRGDGREVYYSRKDAIIAIEVSAAGLPFGEAVELFRRPTTGWSEQWTDGFDVTADGKRFLITENVGGEGSETSMVVVQNWFADFDR